MKPFRYLYNLPDLGGPGVKKWGQTFTISVLLALSRRSRITR